MRCMKCLVKKISTSTRWVCVDISSSTEPVGLFILLTHEKRIYSSSLTLARQCCNWSVNKPLYSYYIYRIYIQKTYLYYIAGVKYFECFRSSCCIKVIFSSKHEFSFKLREREFQSALLCLAPLSLSSD